VTPRTEDLWDYWLMSRNVLIQRGMCITCAVKPAKVEYYCWQCWGYVE
jgi:hypothetical protein